LGKFDRDALASDLKRMVESATMRFSSSGPATVIPFLDAPAPKGR
jgi:hypothetical protein